MDGRVYWFKARPDQLLADGQIAIYNQRLPDATLKRISNVGRPSSPRTTTSRAMQRTTISRSSGGGLCDAASCPRARIDPRRAPGPRCRAGDLLPEPSGADPTRDRARPVRSGRQATDHQGAIATGGSYFANVVGTVYQPTGATTTDQFGNTVAVMAALPDKYLRLRHNGEQAVLDSKMGPAILTQAAALGVKIYRLLRTSQTDAGCWSSDGATCGPDYIATVGLIQ